MISRVKRVAVGVGIGAMLTFAFVPESARLVASNGWEVIATGLDNPRGIAFGADGALYVTEAGKGGDGACIAGPEGEACYGATGALTRIWSWKKHFKQERVLTGLPSLAPPPTAPNAGSGALGPHDITFDDRGAWLTIGLGANPAVREQLGPAGERFGRLVRLSSKDKPRSAADLAGYELEANPDEGLPDSNPYGLDALDRRRVVADAGGNSLVEVDRRGISTLAVFPIRMVQNPFAPPGTLMPMQAVPTTVVKGPDGALYVGQLTGFPFPQGGARVYRVPARGGTPKVYADGFTNIIDIAFGRDGALYVLELASSGLLSGNPQGALIKIGKHGARTTIASEGLSFPGGFVIAKNGAIYVTNNSTSAGTGEVVRIAR
jgi:sugar lactone lactonase YvrE